MGNRANVYLHHGHELGVYLYTHWAGDDLPETVRTALDRGEARWTDNQYLARIVFDEMLGDRHGEETGFGISAVLCDGARRIVDVDTAEQNVTLIVDDARQASETFTEYVARERADWPPS
jgi:hypothetical protein